MSHVADESSGLARLHSLGPSSSPTENTKAPISSVLDRLTETVYI